MSSRRSPSYDAVSVNETFAVYSTNLNGESEMVPFGSYEADIAHTIDVINRNSSDDMSCSYEIDSDCSIVLKWDTPSGEIGFSVTSSPRHVDDTTVFVIDDYDTKVDQFDYGTDVVSIVMRVYDHVGNYL